MLFRSDANAVYAGLGGLDQARGYVLFMKNGSLVGQALDPSRRILQGDPVTLANDIDTFASLSLIPVAASNNGVLAYQSVGERTRQLVWVDRNGQQLGIAAEPGDYGIPRLSPGGSRVAVEKFASNGKHTDVWLLNTEGGAEQFTRVSSGSQSSPVWSPDGSRILFGDNRDGVGSIYSKEVGANGAEEAILRGTFSMRPTDWSRDGKYVLLDSVGEDNRSHVWALSLLRRQASSIVNTGHQNDTATLSPDGKWVAYQSSESGAPEVYVQPFEGLRGSTSGRRRASTGGGGLPRWSRDGAELYYVTSMGYLMSVAVRFAGGNPEFAAPRTLFRTRQFAKTWNFFDVSGDGQRFVVNVPLEDSTSSPITIVTNWAGKLKN
jgi:eukaryotic-like serine/threonine-protein kinase